MIAEIEILNEILEYNEKPYKIIRLIAESGQRDVFECIDKEGKRFVIKISEAVFYENYLRLKREFELLLEFDSEYYTKVYLFDYITKEQIDFYIDSINFTENEKLESLRKKRIPPFYFSVEEYIENIPWSDLDNYFFIEKNTFNFCLDLFEALSLLWNSKGRYIHRDIKDSNILIRKENYKPVVLDLGIIKSYKRNTMNITGASNMPFSPQYSAPELFENRKQEIDFRADQFSIGVLLYKLLTNTFPYGDLETIQEEKLYLNVKKGEFSSILKIRPELNKNFCKFIERLIDPKQFNRFRTLEMILEELKNIKKELDI